MTSKQQNNGPDKLVNLGLKAGDVVRFQDCDPDAVEDRDGKLWVNGMAFDNRGSPNWTVVSRASQAKPDLSNPDKLTFGEMPDAMKGAMLLAHHRGEAVEWWFDDDWMGCEPIWVIEFIYRVKPKAPDDIVLYGVGTFFNEIQASHDTHKITIPADESRQPLPGTYSCGGRNIIVEAV